jgi:hypothetical protein
MPIDSSEWLRFERQALLAIERARNWWIATPCARQTQDAGACVAPASPSQSSLR